LELAGEQMLETLVIHDQHDQSHASNADLQTPTATANRHQPLSAPIVSGPARSYAASVLAAKNETPLIKSGTTNKPSQ